MKARFNKAAYNCFTVSGTLSSKQIYVISHSRIPKSLHLRLYLAIARSTLDPKVAICIPVIVDALTNLHSAQPADVRLANCTPATKR